MTPILGVGWIIAPWAVRSLGYGHQSTFYGRNEWPSLASQGGYFSISHGHGPGWSTFGPDQIPDPS